VIPSFLLSKSGSKTRGKGGGRKQEEFVVSIRKRKGGGGAQIRKMAVSRRDKWSAKTSRLACAKKRKAGRK
jgi:hypothetical protein